MTFRRLMMTTAEIQHNGPRWILRIQERSEDMRQLPDQRTVYPFQGLRKDRAAAYLEGLRGKGR